MPLKTFSFLNTSANAAEGRNWRTLDSYTKTIVRTDLAMTAGTATPVVDSGYFTLYGPIVFYVIKVTLNNNDGWTTASYIPLPYDEFIANGVRQVSHMGHAYVGSTGVTLNNTYMGSVTETNRLFFSAAYTNTTGSDQVVFLQGWYFRN